MTERSELDASREFARAEVRRLLDIDEPALGALFEVADDALGERAPACVRLVREARPTRRASASAHVAALIIGTRELGDDWWRRAGDGLLAAGGDDPLAATARALADACADERWGEPIGHVDLNDPRSDDRVELPGGALPGDTFVASFDPGCRVVVEVVERDGRPGSVLGDLRYDDTEDVRWAWEVAIDIGPIRLPGEIDGRDRDPFAARLKPDAARRLRAWAERHEPDGERLGPPWRTRADVWEARFRLGLPYGRSGEWWPFEVAVRAAVDGDDETLGYALARLIAP